VILAGDVTAGVFEPFMTRWVVWERGRLSDVALLRQFSAGQATDSCRRTFEGRAD